MEKTNAMRKLASLKITYKEYEYDAKEALSGTEVAKMIGKDPVRVFKTLVTTGKTGAHYVFLVPAGGRAGFEKGGLGGG